MVILPPPIKVPPKADHPPRHATGCLFCLQFQKRLQYIQSFNNQTDIKHLDANTVNNMYYLLYDFISMMQWTSSGTARGRNGVVQCPPMVALLGRAANPGRIHPPIFDLHPPNSFDFHPLLGIP